MDRLFSGKTVLLLDSFRKVALLNLLHIMEKEYFLKILSLLFIIAITLITCQEEAQMTFNENDLSQLNISQKKLDQLKSKRILLGHQSVGNNILDGIKKLMECNAGLHLTIQEVNSSDVFDQPLFGHFFVGRNTDPKSKCDSFKKMMDSGIGKNVDIAFFKLCFVDIQDTTNIEQVFDFYVETMEYLKNKYPEVTFIHVTTPLTTIPDDPITKIKSLMKRIIKKPDWVYTSLVQRNKYNNLLVANYGGKEPVFNLATIESTWPDGHTQKFTYHGENYYSLVPLYAYDEGHLNNYGQIQAAKALITSLCELN